MTTQHERLVKRADSAFRLNQFFTRLFESVKDVKSPALQLGATEKEEDMITTVPTVEDDIRAAGLEAPRVTPNDIEKEIQSEHYFTADEGTFGEAYMLAHETNDQNFLWGPHPTLRLLTICVLVLKNGFSVTGESACASPENFDAQIGRRIARDNAIQKCWPLLGFRLRDELSKKL